jgi:hypothetical protein
MTPKEILKEIQDTEFGFNFIDMDGRTSYKHERVFSFKDERFYELRQSLTELEELKRDVKRYFETRNKLKTILPSVKDITEFWELEERLEKVGKEE